VELVDVKLRESRLAPLREQASRFGKSAAQLADLERQIDLDLRAVVRADEPRFDLTGMLDAFDALWARSR
jgi:hypothetical protein